MFQPGQIIGDMYRIERLLGAGGMADVYVVKHVRLPKHFALKVLRLESGERSSFLERFRREAEILATLKNAHLVNVFDRNEMPDGNPYLVMELLEGEDLSQFLTKGTSPLSVSTALNICNQVGEALEEAHQAGIVHRDLKPSNIFLCQREAYPNFVKVLDFGIAKQTAVGRTPLTEERSLMGTPGYMAPEQALGKIAQIDHRTDQFALAAILYEMLAGKPAFYGPEDTTYSILNRVVNEQPPPLRHHIINQAIQRALSKKPEDRFPSVKDFLSAAGANSLTIHIAPKIPAPVFNDVSDEDATVRFPRKEPELPNTQPVPKPKHLSQALLGSGVGVVLALVLILAVTLWRRQSAEIPAPEPTPDAAQPMKPIVTALSTAPSDGPNTTDGASGRGTNPPNGAALVSPSTTDGLGTGKSGSDSSTPLPVNVPGKTPVPPAAPPDAGAKAPLSAGTGAGTNTVKPPVVVKPPPAARSYVMVGVTKPQEKLLLRCAHTFLDGISGLANQIIKLERSGVLQITDAPPAVYETNFRGCLRSVFSNTEIIVPVPQSVTIRVRGGR